MFKTIKTIAVFLLLLAACSAPSLVPQNPFRRGHGVWFIAENREITAKHVVVDSVGNLKFSDPDIHIGDANEYRGYELYSDDITCTLEKPFHLIYMVIPEIGKVKGYIYKVYPEKFITIFQLNVAPGFSGSPVLDWKTGKVLGIISGHTVIEPGFEVTIVQRLRKSDFK